MTENEILNEEQAATLLGVTPRCLRQWRQRKGVPHFKVSHKVVRFRTGDLLTWLDGYRVAMRTLPKASNSRRT